ncbi:hypothetical protein IscW_ISCW022350 [Ixodes scapularis]|uniref:Uncharacterized protein n=1 Tax=Ixodes scapularis TaxID=6945 RepID=B7QBF5_IXOSC|nr:hypothetical protein IscW_ISCW022350 [Ixodes scapularis]|eukprot:XP_002412881.1 hypothetical protein IscW_ISCW022350 [Ixodes scapularis]
MRVNGMIDTSHVPTNITNMGCPQEWIGICVQVKTEQCDGSRAVPAILARDGRAVPVITQWVRQTPSSIFSTCEYPSFSPRDIITAGRGRLRNSTQSSCQGTSMHL